MEPRLLPPAIEIFRPGRHIDDAGAVHAFSEADIAAIVVGYDPAVREAPLTVGHPADNLPAYGWVKRLGMNTEGRLVMDAHQVEPQFAELVAEGRYKKRSASFYPPEHPNNPTPGRWYLRHVAFLGAQPPAIAGLKDFADDAAGTISFSDGDAVHATEPTEKEQQMDKDLQAANERAVKAEADAKAAKAALTAAEAKADAANKAMTQFAEAQRAGRHTAHVSFAEAQVTAGKLLPKDRASAVAVLDILADSQPVSFAEGDVTRTLSPADWLKGLIAAAAPVVSFGEHAPGNAGTGAGQSVAGLSDEALDQRARAHAAKHSVSYAEALTAICSFTA